MKRREFLKTLGLGGAIVAVPAIASLPEPEIKPLDLDIQWDESMPAGEPLFHDADFNITKAGTEGDFAFSLDHNYLHLTSGKNYPVNVRVMDSWLNTLHIVNIHANEHHVLTTSILPNIGSIDVYKAGTTDLEHTFFV